MSLPKPSPFLSSWLLAIVPFGVFIGVNILMDRHWITPSAAVSEMLVTFVAVSVADRRIRCLRCGELVIRRRWKLFDRKFQV
jgi:hypothetical protein